MTVEEALTSGLPYCCLGIVVWLVLATIWEWVEENSDGVLTVIWLIAIAVWIYCLAMLSDVLLSDYHSASGLTIGTLSDMMSTIYCSTCLIGVVVMVVINWGIAIERERISFELVDAARDDFLFSSELENQAMTNTSIQISMRLARGEDWDREKIAVKELQHMLRSLNLQVSGNKSELVSRIEIWYEEQGFGSDFIKADEDE